MRLLSGLVALGSLLLSIVLLPVPGGVLFSMFGFGVFLLALLGVFTTVDDHRVEQHKPAMEPTKWRDGR